MAQKCRPNGKLSCSDGIFQMLLFAGDADFVNLFPYLHGCRAGDFLGAVAEKGEVVSAFFFAAVARVAQNDGV